MTRLYAKNPLNYCMLLVYLLSYSCSSSDLSKEEQKLVGPWELKIAPSNDGSKNVSYIRLGQDRQGLKGILHQKGTEFIFAPMLSYNINHWLINEDTLIITYTFEEGVISVPGKEDQQYDAFQKKDYLIIKELGENYFIAESYHPDIPFTSEHMYSRVPINQL